MEISQQGESSGSPHSGGATSKAAQQTKFDTSTPEGLGALLIEKKLLSQEKFAIAINEYTKGNREGSFESVLARLGFTNAQEVREVVGQYSGQSVFTLEEAQVDRAVITKIPKDIAMKLKAMPIRVENNQLIVVTSDVYNILSIDAIKKHYGTNIQVKTLYADEGQILELIEKYHDYDMSIDGILNELSTKCSKGISNAEIEDDNYENPIIRLADALLINSVRTMSSDIHLEPEEEFIRIRYRIDGQLQEVCSFHKDYWNALLVRIKIMSDMNIAESRIPQDGRINMQYAGRDISFRVATHPTITGENVVLRLLDKKQSLVPLLDIGFSQKNYDVLHRVIRKPEGIIIVTGPTGSGKTTTLYSILNTINVEEKNIMTMEDPVEYQLSMIRQSAAKDEAGFSFNVGIKSMMRQDPDIIFIGEVRDEETASMAIRAAITGHQVYTTLHTNDAIGAISRLVDMNMPHHLISDAMSGVVAQRLVLKLCAECKDPVQATAEEMKKMRLPENTSPPTIYKAKGCKACNKGYKGRIAIMEILDVNRDIQEMIATHSTNKQIYDYAVKLGYRPMMYDGIEKILRGLTDLVSLEKTVNMY